MQIHSRSNVVTTACMIAVWGAYTLSARGQESSVKKPERVVPAGIQKQLLVDDFVIAEKHNVSRSLGKVQKHGIVLKPTLPTDFIPPLGHRHDEDYEDDLKTGRKPDGSPIALDFGYYTTVGDSLELNIDASSGEYFVEVLDKDNRPFANYDEGHSQKFKGTDEIRSACQWSGHRNLSSLKGKVIKLRFHLRNAKWYSFTVKES